MTIKQLSKITFDFIKKQEEVNNRILDTLNLIVNRLDKLEKLVYDVIEINHLKTKK